MSNYAIEPKSRMQYDIMVGENGGYLQVETGWDIHGEKMEYPIMQFTGLHDKNGKEIYEGDLLKDDRNEVLEVKWGEAEWLAGKLALNANNFFEGKCNYLEVIGNVWENPKLPIGKGVLVEALKKNISH